MLFILQVGTFANAAGVGGGALYLPLFNIAVGMGKCNSGFTSKCEDWRLSHMHVGTKLQTVAKHIPSTPEALKNVFTSWL